MINKENLARVIKGRIHDCQEQFPMIVSIVISGDLPYYNSIVDLICSVYSSFNDEDLKQVAAGIQRMPTPHLLMMAIEQVESQLQYNAGFDENEIKLNKLKSEITSLEEKGK